MSGHDGVCTCARVFFSRSVERGLQVLLTESQFMDVPLIVSRRTISLCLAEPQASNSSASKQRRFV